MTRPRIGIPLDLDEGRGRYEIARAYADAVAEAGGLALALPYRGDVEDYLALCDGLLVTGGAFDLPPESYGEERRESCGPARAARTEFEWAVTATALARGLPLLGVCGGMQLLNVVRGGSLYQHLPEDLGVCHEQPAPKDVPSHEVEVSEGSLLARLVGPFPLPVNSTHHQAVRRAGDGVLISARAEDGVVEALELPDLPFAVGVQWHPERAAAFDPRQAGLFRGLVQAAEDLRR